MEDAAWQRTYRRAIASLGRRAKGETIGKVVKKQMTPTKIKGHEVKASKADPQIIVESSKSGAKAAHKPSALKKKS